MSREILGHDRPLRALGDLLARDHLAHAYLFTGIAGVGKGQVALELARAFLCPEEGAKSGRPCTCPSCLAAAVLRHPDLLFIHDFQTLRWENAGRLQGLIGAGGAPPETISGVIDELRGAGLILEPSSAGAGKRLAFTLDFAHIFRANQLEPTPFADRLARMEERGTLSPAARRLAAMLYFDDTSRLPYRSSIGIHLVARREPLTPDRGSLREFLARTSFWGRGKVVIIDDAHHMTEEAQNALLKTLEEPPANSLLILVTDQPAELEPTIRSRTQEVRFARLAPDVLSAALREQGASAEASAFLAGWADGSLGRALEGELEGLVSRRDLAIDLHVALAGRDIARAMRVASVLASGEEEGTDRVRKFRRMTRNLELLMLWYRDLAVASAEGPGAGLLNADLAGHVHREASAQPTAFWRQSFQIVARNLAELGPSSDYRLQAEGLVADLALAGASNGGGQASS